MSTQSTRDRLIQAALALFKEKGYTAASTREIAQKAGVNHLTLFRHFGNKQNLFRESVIQHVASGDFIGELKAILTGDLREDLSLIAKAYLKENLEKGTVFLLYFNDAVSDKEVCELIMDIPRRLNRFLEAYFAKLYAEKKISDGNFQMLSQMFFGLLNQYIMFQHLPGFKESFNDRIDDYVEECVDLFYTKLEKEVPS
ncbi:TetR/AcrR family transcriptional regulator [Bacillus licheniformis]|jgi:AcrR family transcriptional regulator|uniref:HTH-type transcriptional repressor n=1 Tax=Bacillus licheniformis TaxID=1402 RepID=A0A415J0H7_BACLI|nr:MULTISPECIES: TetR/AcrR family transcriptional regulator [Bacillus]MBJ7886705.1 TetR/AcrR family transcriptional regulator [Bacillaceae bacterium HSR45]MBY8349531.1 TetR/AcrR family transcriptional regulator [Bacillus sp. PCH94]MDP4081365.1 TetR/AcrR family transcriptional regulator [Bacillota bacterium]MEE1181519.1 TetR/AcrR family transcriptional regulator [Treponema sp.]AKQ72191.1 transcriptional regulator [Bacillus licheniformis WX-02]